MTKPSFARRQPVVTAFAIVAATLVLGSQVWTQGRPSRRTTTVRGREAVEGEVLVKFARGSSDVEQAQLETQLDTEEREPVGPRITRIKSRAYDVATLLAYLRTRTDVEYAEPNYILYALATPNDQHYPLLWGLNNIGQSILGVRGVNDADIDAPEAWDVSTGSTANVVAIIDTGIDYTHPDLADNVWSAPAAFSVNIGGKITNCPAGSHGYNAILKTCDPKDDNDHGSHVMGTIGALGNNIFGVTGINWTASVMGGKFLGANGSGTLANAINAIDFAIQAKAIFGATNGANVRVLSNSWGGGGFSQALLDEINKAKANDMLFVAAAGNASSDNDVVAAYPASYNTSNMVAVAATDNTDHLASFSNYGAAKVHIAAPGVNIASTVRNNSYAYFSGTSMATPHVSGAAALILSRCATMNTADLKALILNPDNVDAVPALNGLVSTDGRLNVDKALRACTPLNPVPAPQPIPAPPDTLTAATGSKRGQISLDWNASALAVSYTVKVATSSGGPYTIEASGLTRTDYTDTGLKSGATFFYVVTAVNGMGESTNSTPTSAKAR